MGKKRSENSIYWRGVIGGMIPLIRYFYAEITHPNPYNIFYTFYSPVLMIFGGLAGLLWAAWYLSD